MCTRLTLFAVIDPADARESLICVRCRSNARNRHVAKLLRCIVGVTKSLDGDSSVKDVYIAAVNGPLASALRGWAAVRIEVSDYLPGVPRGSRLAEGTCQDLQSLTYDDESFDIVVTEDVLEHVRDPRAAFGEIRRVLRVGGRHLFTVPLTGTLPTLVRVDTTHEEDVLLMEPEWHGDPGRGAILCYRTYGFDLLTQLAECGFHTRVHFAGFADRREAIFDSIVLESVKVT